MSNKLILILALAGVSAFLCSCQSGTGRSDDKHSLNSDSVTISLLKEAYLYGYPLVVMHTSMRVMTNVEKPVSGARLLAPVNQIANATTFPDDKFRDVVRANCDTYYTMGWLNLKDGPMVLNLPDTKGRYYLFPMLDAWTNVFASPGKRTTGTGAQQFVIAAPGWHDEVPAGMTLIQAPTDLVWVIGRVQVNSARDGSTIVKSIQDGISLKPLAPGTSKAGTVDPTIPAKSPNDIVAEMSGTEYFKLLNSLMVNNPPPPADSAILKRLKEAGISPGADFGATKFSAVVTDSLQALPMWGKKALSSAGLTGATPVNGWNVNKNLGSYGTNYLFRAGVAFGGLGANLDADAIYPASLTDVDGDAYDGSKYKYILHFDADKLPPAKAFWSLTMYDGDGFMCANPINRFAIGDRDNLEKNKDGSVDILIQHDKPKSTRNWLPAPDGPFNLLMRIYWPDERMTSGQWSPPGVAKVKN
jgi:hypothetical protein